MRLLVGARPVSELGPASGTTSIEKIGREAAHITKSVTERVNNHLDNARALLVHRRQFIIDAARAARELRNLER